MLNLLVILIERIGVIVLVAFLLTRTEVFKRTIVKSTQLAFKVQIYLAVIFGLFGILGTYTGIVVQAHNGIAIANSRVVGVFIAGLLGGQVAGIGAGLIAGLHRLSMGGFTAGACAVATILEGAIGGYLGKKHNGFRISGWRAFAYGAAAEVIQMLIIIALARPVGQAIQLVSLIGLPMIFANGAGIATFILIIKSVVNDQERIGALQAQKALLIANQTLPYLRKGLNPESALAVAQIIKEGTDVAAVAITDQVEILAHIGLGDDHHISGVPIRTALTSRVLETGRIEKAETTNDIGCNEEACPLARALIVPLRRKEDVIGTLKLYFRPNEKISSLEVELAQGLAALFSTQLALGYAEAKAQLLSKAEIKALQAQINPHFLFNSLNVIVSLIRKEPEVARNLIINLADFFRSNLQSTNLELVTVAKEIQHVRSFLAIEQARYGDKLEVKINLCPEHLNLKIPPLTLQPLVENAIGHGLKKTAKQGMIDITSEARADKVIIQVKDNGVGIAQERLQKILSDPVTSRSGTGLALKNVHDRLKLHFGKDCGLRITSQVGRGTVVEVIINGQEKT